MDSAASRPVTNDPKKRGYNPLRPGNNPLRPGNQQNSRNTSSVSIGSEINNNKNDISTSEKIHNAKTLYNNPSTTSVGNGSENYDPHKTIFVGQNDNSNKMNDAEVKELNEDIDQLSKNINDHLKTSNAGNDAPKPNPMAPQSSNSSLPAPAPAPAPVQSPPKPQPQSQPPAPTPSAGNDNPLLNSTKSVICAYCNEKIGAGGIVSANKKYYHQRHFLCSSCSKSLCDSVFHVVDDNLLCNDCYNNQCGVKCAYCNEYIEGEYTVAAKKNWHPEHFLCSECHQPLGNGIFEVKDDKIYCHKDYQKLFGLTCAKCNEPILSGGYITALEKPWHVDCFVCTVCNKPFSSTTFNELDGYPYCPEHYTVASQCEFCKSKIVDKRIRVGDKFYHANHVFCTVCKNPISNVITNENDDVNKYFKISGTNVVCKNCVASQTM